MSLYFLEKNNRLLNNNEIEEIREIIWRRRNEKSDIMADLPDH
jgi:hypothetical protein